LAIPWLDELISKLNIVDVISKYVPLKRKGRTYWGCCPFHHEKEPSFAVNEEKQFFHCFGCKESGNVIGFIQKIESIDFWDAVKICAKEANFVIPENDFKQKDTSVDGKKRDRLLALMRAAGLHYYENLSAPEAEEARAYLKARNIDEKLTRRFALGYSNGSSEMISYLTKLGYTKAEMKEVGLIETNSEGSYDVFYNRLIIPIVNHIGEVVAFGGRLLNPSTHIAVKYRNSSNTPIFDKSRTLFALNLVKKKKQKEKINYVILTEGYMDVMMLHKAGFDTAIANMGTALTPQQAKLISNVCKNVYTCYDGDGAGQKATLRSLDILKDAGLNVKVIVLPDELDPDDLIKRDGKEGFLTLMKEARTPTQYQLEVIEPKYDLSTSDGKANYTIEALKILGRLKNPVEQEEYLGVVIAKTGYEKKTLMKQLGLAEEEIRVEEAREQDRAERREEAEETKAMDKGELFIVASYLFSKEYASLSADVYPYLTNDTLKRAYEYVVSCSKSGERCNPSSLFTLYPDDGDMILLVNYDFMDGDDKKKFDSCVVKMKESWLKGEKAALAKAFSETKDVKLLMEIKKIDAKLQQLKAGGNDD